MKNDLRSDRWMLIPGLCSKYPNGEDDRLVWENIISGDHLVRRFNEVGDMIYSNGHRFGEI